MLRQLKINQHQNKIDNVPGTGQILLESDYLKRIFAVSPLSVNTYLNLDDPDDPKNANIELSIDLSSIEADIALNRLDITTNTSTLTNHAGDIAAINAALATKADQATTYTKTEVDNSLALKQDKVANVSDTEIGYLDGVTSNIQTQLNQREPLYTTISPIVKKLNHRRHRTEIRFDCINN